MPKKRPNLCTKDMTFEECELAIVRQAVQMIEDKAGKKKINTPEIQDIIHIVEAFLQETKRICYGGTAINNLLPIYEQFYNKEIELPDYDFYSPDPLNDAKNLADIYHKKGYTEVEAKSGMHPGTFKVFVNYIPVADITYLPPQLYKTLMDDSLSVNGIMYCSINYLRMSMYLELSRPQGDVSRWEKVLKRLGLLNKHYPLRGKSCDIDSIQRLFEYGMKPTIVKRSKKGGSKTKLQEDVFLNKIEDKIFFVVKDTLINQGCVFFGAFANRLYLKEIPKLRKKNVPRIPDFDVLSEDPIACSRIIKERLKDIGITDVEIVEHEGIGEIVAPHYEIVVGDETVVFIYKPLSCHSYNEIRIDGQFIKIATLDTMLSFYLAFLYSNRSYYDEQRILCMCEFLYRVLEKNRINQSHGILRRFSMDCYGTAHAKEELLAEKSRKFNELKDKRDTEEYEWYFLRYLPGKEKSVRKKKKTVKKAPKKKKNKASTKKKGKKTKGKKKGKGKKKVKRKKKIRSPFL